MTTPEGKVKDKVKKAFDTLPRRYRFMPVQNGMGKPGLDFFCCVDGAFIAIETKRAGKNLTDLQKVTAREIAEAGGIVFAIRDQSEIDQMMLRLKGALPLLFGTIYDSEGWQLESDQ